MRTYHSPTLGDVTFTEEQYHKLLRRFNPNKELWKEYKYPCICPGNDVYNCGNCKPFGGETLACLVYLRDVVGHDGAPLRTGLCRAVITVYESVGLRDLTTISNALLGMVKT